MFNSQIIKPVTAEEMAEAFIDAEHDIKEAYLLLSKAEKRLNAAFGDYTHYGSFDAVRTRDLRWNKEKPLETVNQIMGILNRSAWKRIVEKLQVRQRMSSKRKDELDKKLEKGELPEITVENIFSLLEHYMNDAEEIQRELVKEVFDFLRPRSRWHEYKTNNKFVVGKKVILSGCIERQWSGGGFRVNCYQHDDLVALDRTFHILDGAPTGNSYDSPLTDTIQTAELGIGETDYFEFKCYKNCNIHITFKRLDLVKKLNTVAGGMNLHEKGNGNE